MASKGKWVEAGWKPSATSAPRLPPMRGTARTTRLGPSVVTSRRAVALFGFGNRLDARGRRSLRPSSERHAYARWPTHPRCGRDRGVAHSPKCRRESTAETPNVIFTEPPTGAATPYLGGSICGLAPARPPPTAPAPSSPRSETGIGGGQQAARAGRSVACRRGGDPTRDKDQPEMSERKHGGDP